MKYFYSFVLILIFQSAFSQNDCTKALIVCGNTNYTGLSATGAGIQELNSGNNCGSQENNSLWLKVNINTGGTLGFTITPQSTNIVVDFDFFVFGPNATCGNIGNSIRCSTTNPQAASTPTNVTGMNASEVDTNEGPGQFGNNFVQWLTVLDNETYFIVIDRPAGTSNFSLTWSGTATFFNPPVFDNATTGTTLDLSNCDSDGTQDNKTPFDLTQNSAIATGSQTNIVVSYYTTANNAINGLNPIATPTNFRNTTNPQTIYIRLTNTLTGCFSTSTFLLNVTPYNTPNPLDLSDCDTNNDGFVTFDLSQNDTVLINGNSNVSVAYYATNNGTVALPNNYTNTVPNTNQTVWAKISDTVSGCYIYKSFQLIINKIPATIPAQLSQCDYGFLPDGLTTFNLNDANNTLTASDPNLATKFYLNASDAQNDINALSNTFNNTTNPQTITVRVTNLATLCYGYSTITLNVTTNPSVEAILDNCDDAIEDGFTSFNLDNAGFTTPTYTVTYFENLNDALTGTNPINTIYTNTIVNQQTVYARVGNPSSCYAINTIVLNVRPLPNIRQTGNEIYCLNKPTVPATLDAGIISGNPASYTYLWSPNGETTSTIQVITPGNYTVVVKSAYGCTKDRVVTVQNSTIATIENVEIVDLSDNNTVTILTAEDENFYQYSIDLPSGPFQNSNYFEYVATGVHTVYVSDKDGCGVVSKQISVLGIPAFFTPNSDGYNDIWKIKGLSGNLNTNASLAIFDQFGKLLKLINNMNEGWDGSYNGIVMPESDYWFVLSLQDGRVVKGHFSLVF